MKTANHPLSKLKFLSVLFVMAALIAFATAAHAADTMKFSNIAPVKEAVPFAPADVQAKMKIVQQIKPYNKEDLSFEITLPKEWTDNTQPPPVGTNVQKLSDTVPSPLGKFIGAPINLLRSYLTIEAMELPYEVSARNWVANYILTSGFTLTALTEKSPKEITATYVQVERDQAFVVRVRAIINGESLVLVRYYLPQDNQKEEEALQGQVVSSFNLLNISKLSIEKRKEYGFLDQSYFNYPDSWELKEKNILSIERMSALLYQQSRRENNQLFLDGHIKVSVISKLLKTTMAHEIENFRKNIDVKDYTIGKLIEKVEYKYNPDIKSGKAQIYELVPTDTVSMSPYEFLVAVMEGDEYFYIISMISPSRDEEFFTWAQNIEAVRIVVESMRRQNVVLDVNPNDPYFDYLKE